MFGLNIPSPGDRFVDSSGRVWEKARFGNDMLRVTSRGIPVYGLRPHLRDVDSERYKSTGRPVPAKDWKGDMFTGDGRPLYRMLEVPPLRKLGRPISQEDWRIPSSSSMLSEGICHCLWTRGFGSRRAVSEAVGAPSMAG